MRYIGIVGLLFVSIGSIIGSGWLFGALTASKETDPAAVTSTPPHGSNSRPVVKACTPLRLWATAPP